MTRGNTSAEPDTVPTSDGVAAFLFTWVALGGSRADWQLEFRFAPPRRWRFDLARPSRLIAVEVDGGTWTGGRHVRGAGYERDCRKLNAAAALGWRVWRLTSAMASDRVQIEQIMEATRESAGGGADGD